MKHEDFFKFKKIIEKRLHIFNISNIRYENTFISFNLSTRGTSCFFGFKLFDLIISILKQNSLDSLFNFNASLFTIVNETTIEVSLATAQYNEMYINLNEESNEK